MLVTLSGIVMLVSPAQQLNAQEPILVTLPGIVILLRLVHGKSVNPGIVTIKMLCDGLGITLPEFFDSEEFKNLQQEIE